MKINKLWAVIPLILVIGCFATSFIKQCHKNVMTEETLWEAETETESGGSYIARLEELDEKISRNSFQPQDTTSSLKSAADQKRDLWEAEMQRILGILEEKLSDKEKEELLRNQKIWMRSREAIALEASKKQRGSTLEEVEYILSYSESTRSRTYELAEEYAVILAEAE
ncbi:MAG: lysozyme inhibitor LprI family protein [Brotaphodocola sp.]